MRPAGLAALGRAATHATVSTRTCSAPHQDLATVAVRETNGGVRHVWVPYRIGRCRWAGSLGGAPRSTASTSTLAVSIHCPLAVVFHHPHFPAPYLGLGAAPPLFFATRQATEMSNVLLGALTLLRDKEHERLPKPPREDAEPQVTISIEPVRPIPPYAGTAERNRKEEQG